MNDPQNLPQPLNGELNGDKHTLPIRVYYEDTDFTGIVYHASYVRFMERGRSEFLRTLYLQSEAPPEMGTFAITHLEIDYKSPARIHDALHVITEFKELKGPRMRFEQSIYRNDTLLIQGKVEAVAITPDGRARRPSPQEVTVWKSLKSQ